MKSLCSAAWLLTVAFGNLVVVIIAESTLFSNQVRYNRLERERKVRKYQTFGIIALYQILLTHLKCLRTKAIV